MPLIPNQDENLAYLVTLACHHCRDLRAYITNPEDPNPRLLLLRPKSLQSIPAFLRTPAGAPDTWKRSPDSEAARPTDPMPLPILCQLHFESLLHSEVSCSLGKRLSVVQTGKGPGRKKPQKWKEGFPESDRRRQGSGGQLTLLGPRKCYGAVGRTLPESASWLELCAHSLQVNVTSSRFQN